jgi:hypothetical protein
VGYFALGAQSSWLVGIRFKGKSGHLERMEMTESIREVLRWLLAAQLDCQKKKADGKSMGSCRLLVLPSQNRNTPYGPPCHTVLCDSLPPLDALSVNPPRRQCGPSRTERFAAAARPCYRRSCTLIPEYAHPQPLPPLRYILRSTDLSIISRSSARP